MHIFSFLSVNVIEVQLLKGVYSLRPDGESRNKAFWTQLDDLRQPGFLSLLGKAHLKWWYETDLVESDPKGV